MSRTRDLWLIVAGITTSLHTLCWFGSCIKGDNCELCHGIFEYWLHPANYKTIPCHFGTLCSRQVCFFAHTLKELRCQTKYNWCYVYQYPPHIQSYPDILIENELNGNWMIIPCNPQLSPPPLPHDQHCDTTVVGHENSSTPVQQIPQENMTMYELFAPSPPPSQSQPKNYQTVQNESNFSFFSASHAKLIEELKNLETGSTSHTKVNTKHDDKGKRPLECESEDEEFPNLDWIFDLLGDEFEGSSL